MIRRAAAAVTLVGALASCSMLRPAGPPSASTGESGDLGSWRGTITLRSSSVPNPYNWSPEARIDGRRVNLTVGWFATRSDT